jgi:hypothetical protein
MYRIHRQNKKTRPFTDMAGKATAEKNITDGKNNKTEDKES